MFFHDTWRWEPILEDNDIEYIMNKEISEHENKYIIILEVPGMNSKHIDITAENDRLQIIGKNNTRSIKKIYNIDDNIDIDNITAKVIDGILEIELPKISPKRYKKIKIMSE